MAVDISPQALSILVAVLVVLLTAVLIYFWRQRRGARSGILMVGLNDSGKTLLFSRIVHNTFADTYTSVKENVGDLVCSKSTLKIIDIPGHERVRGKFFDQYKNNARGIAFMVDSSSLQKDVRDVAEYLYSLLTDPVVYNSAPMFAIVCNKQDQTLAKSSSVVKKLLEQEINTLRKTKGNRLASLSENEKQITIGKEGVDFKFEHLDSIQVDFIESTLIATTSTSDAVESSDDDDCDTAQVEEWLEKVAA